MRESYPEVQKAPKAQKAQMTRQRLASYVSLKMEVENQAERLVRLKNEAEMPAAKQSDVSKHTQGNGDRLERAIIRYMEYKDRITPKIQEIKVEMREIENAIDDVPDPLEREVLRLRYIDGEYCRLMPWKDVAAQLFGDNDERHLLAAYRLHGRALVSIAKMAD